MLQLEFFKTEKEIEIENLIYDVKKLKESNEKVRRKMFAELKQVQNKYEDIQEEFEAWKKCMKNFN